MRLNYNNDTMINTMINDEKIAVIILYYCFEFHTLPQKFSI